MQAGEIRVARVGSGLGRRDGTGRLVPGRYVPGLAERLAAGGGARHATGRRDRLSSRRSKVGLAEGKLKETRFPVERLYCKRPMPKYWPSPPGECVPPRLCCGGRTPWPGGERWGVNILEDAMPDTALYSTYVSTLCALLSPSFE
jgi:hypothetical protein